MANEYILKEYTGGAVATTLATTITNVSTSIVLTTGATFPNGATAPFVIVLDPGTATEEKVLCTSRSVNTLTVLNRGYDGTSAQAHTAGAVVQHVLDAYSIQHAIRVVSGKSETGASSTSGHPLVSGGGGLPAWGQLGTGGIADTAVTAAKLATAIPRGVMGYTAKTTEQTGITTVVDITGLSVTFTAVAGRRYRVTLQALVFSSVANDIVQIQIRDGSGTVLNLSQVLAPSTTFGVSAACQFVTNGWSGSTTVKAAALRNSGTGSVTFDAGATYPAYILVEDIGV